MPRDWFTADLHIGHKNIIKYCGRPWAKDRFNPTKEETAEMDRDLIRRWNFFIKPEDNVYILGDIAYCTTEEHTLEVLEAMNGYKHNIEGNHDLKDADKKRPGIARRLNEKYPHLFASYTPGYLEIVVHGQAIVMCHYALRSWHHDTRGTWNLYGHTHASLEPFGKSVDVGIDNAHNICPTASYRPVSFEELKKYMSKRPLGPHPEFEHYSPGHPEIRGEDNGNEEGQDQAGSAIGSQETATCQEDGSQEEGRSSAAS